MLTFLGQKSQFRLMLCFHVEPYAHATEQNTNQSISKFLICIVCSALFISLPTRNEERCICSSSSKSAKHKKLCNTHAHTQKCTQLTHQYRPLTLPQFSQHQHLQSKDEQDYFRGTYPLLSLNYS